MYNVHVHVHVHVHFHKELARNFDASTCDKIKNIINAINTMYHIVPLEVVKS